MFKTITFAASLLVGGLALSSAPASAAPVSANLPAASALVENAQYGYGYRERRYERRREGVRPGRIVRDLLGVGPRRRDRGYYRGGSGRGYGYGGGRRYDRF
ncbi:hypothetical protein [uncultured Enterovirga sp.]|uniref:hypothetical protein n=1 Tax=uncultured Enterovirga sp. TaxID=2026352 RepID=UPI0035CB912C